MSIGREMPRYKCHKQVWAFKIKSIEIIPRDTSKDIDGMSPPEAGRTAIITPEEDGYSQFIVDEAYVNKHNPKEGGYYVVYPGGYLSYSPAEAFEEGYTRIN